jgi:surfeit locus 1 family protein
MSSTPAEAGRPRLGLRFWPTLLTFLGLVVLVGLGTWQLQRLAWKEGLIARVQAQLAQPPVSLMAGADLAALDFRRVAARGAYRHEAAFAFGLAASGNEPGARLIAPFVLEGGSAAILIDRGWLPESLLPPLVPAGLRPGGTVELEGLARYRGEPDRTWLTPDDRPDRRRWFAWDVPAMAQATGLPLLPLVLVLDRSEGPAGLPKATPVRPEFRNDHLGYALTWYGLALALLAVYVLSSLTRHGKPSP